MVLLVGRAVDPDRDRGLQPLRWVCRSSVRANGRAHPVLHLHGRLLDSVLASYGISFRIDGRSDYLKAKRPGPIP